MMGRIRCGCGLFTALDVAVNGWRPVRTVNSPPIWRCRSESEEAFNGNVSRFSHWDIEIGRGHLSATFCDAPMADNDLSCILTKKRKREESTKISEMFRQLINRPARLPSKMAADWCGDLLSTDTEGDSFAYTQWTKVTQSRCKYTPHSDQKLNPTKKIRLT